MKREVPRLPPETSPIWKDIILGRKNYELKFLAAKILLMRLKMNLKMHPDRPGIIQDAVRQFRDLYQKRGYLPDARADIKRIFGVE